jgi:hypothetical protein
MQNNNNQNFFDLLALFSVALQMAVYEQTQRQSSTDDLMRELQKQDMEYFEKIIENQNRILEKLAELG